MEYLGVAPGPVVGEALDFLLEARLDEGPIDEDDAYAPPRAWARERGIDAHARRETKRSRARERDRAAGACDATSDRGDQAPSLRARQTMVVGERRGAARRVERIRLGSSRVSTRKPARPSSVNTSPMRACSTLHRLAVALDVDRPRSK